MLFEERNLEQQRHLLLVPFYAICDRVGVDAKLDVDGDGFVVVVGDQRHNVGRFTEETLGSFGQTVAEALTNGR